MHPMIDARSQNFNSWNRSPFDRPHGALRYAAKLSTFRIASTIGPSMLWASANDPPNVDPPNVERRPMSVLQ